MEKTITFLAVCIIFLIGFGSTGTSLYNNLNISIYLSYFVLALVLVLLFYKVGFHVKYVNNYLILLLSLLLIFFGLSCFYSYFENHNEIWTRWYTIFISIVSSFFIFFILYRGFLKSKVILISLASVGLLHVFVLTWMWFSIDNPEKYNWVEYLPFFSNIRHLADLLSISFLSSLCLFCNAKKIYIKYLWWVGAVFILSCIFWTGSRAAFIGVTGASFILFVYLERIKFAFNFFIMCVVSILISMVFLVENKSMGFYRIFFTNEKMKNSLNKYTSGRIELYQDAVSYFLEKPYWGYGGEAVRNLKFPLGSNYAAQIHNSILQVLLEFGLIGLILVFLVFLKVFFDLRQLKVNKMNVFYIAIVINIFLSSLFNGGAYYVVTLSLFCIFLAILYSEKYQLKVRVK